MNPDQIEKLVNQAIKNIGCPYMPDGRTQTVLFTRPELDEFVRLVRESDRVVMWKALDAIRSDQLVDKLNAARELEGVLK